MFGYPGRLVQQAGTRGLREEVIQNAGPRHPCDVPGRNFLIESESLAANRE